MDLINKKEVYKSGEVTLTENTFRIKGKDIKRVSLSFGKDAVLIIPVDLDNKLYLVKEARSDGKYKIDFPSGGIEKGESALAAAERELSEELGLEGVMKYLGVFDPFYSAIDMKLHIFLSENVKEQDNNKKLKPEFYENIKKMVVSESELYDLISNGQNIGYYTLGALSLIDARKRQRDIIK
jgi:hypothetical protein